jgi:hypothetical protein
VNEPFLYKEDEPIFWSPGQVIAFVKLLDKLGYSDQFIEEAKDLSIAIPKDFVNFGKKFLFKNKAHDQSPEARAVITSAHCPKRPDPPFPPV